MHFDLTDERTLEAECVATATGLRLGAVAYQKVIVSADADLAASTRRVIEPFVSQVPVPLDIRPAVPPPSPRGRTAATVWRPRLDQRNDLLVEPQRDKSTWRAAVMLDESFRGKLLLHFVDDVRYVRVDGAVVEVTPRNQGADVTVHVDGPRQRIDLTFEPASSKGDVRPVLWVQGAFRVYSLAAWTIEGPGHLHTSGPFRIASPTEDPIVDLVTDGYPFLGSVLRVETGVNIDEPHSEVSFADTGALTTRFNTVRGARPWAWTGSEEAGTMVLEAGRHAVTAEILPNGYNHYGPHHYYLGDHHVVSPQQVAGQRNFADPTDAPANTHRLGYSFRSSPIPGIIVGSELLSRTTHRNAEDAPVSVAAR